MSVTFQAVVFDCANAARVAGFWSSVLERPVDEGASEEFASISRPDGQAGAPTWMFIQVPEGKQVKNRMHPDLSAADLAAEAKRVIELGASLIADHEEGGLQWITFTDPEGNEFDIAQA